MAQQDSGNEKEEKVAGNGRNPILIIIGFFILGLAVAFILFGGNLFAEDASTMINR